MYHEYPYEAQIPILIDGKYETRTFTSDKDVWNVIELLVSETEEQIQKGRDLNIAGSVMAQLPFFSCTNFILDKNKDGAISSDRLRKIADKIDQEKTTSRYT